MRGEISTERLGSNLGWKPPNGACVLTAGSAQGSSTVGLPCVPVLYACGNGTAPAARLQSHNNKASHKQDKAGPRVVIRTVPVGGSKSGYVNADQVGPMSADLPGEPRFEGAGELITKSWIYYLCQHLTTCPPGSSSQRHAQEGWSRHKSTPECAAPRAGSGSFDRRQNHR